MVFFLSFVTLFLLVLAIGLHEFAHAISMKKYGVPIDDMSLLGIGKTLYTFTWKKMFGNTPIYIKMFPVGAYVNPGKKGDAYMQTLSVHARCDIFSAGVFMNVLFAALLLAWVVISQNIFLGIQYHINWMVLLIVPVSYALFHFRKYTYPIQIILGLLLLGWFLYFMGTHFTETVTKNGSIVSIGAEVVKNSKTIAVSSYSVPFLAIFNKAVLEGAGLSLALGVLNILPISMLDGGRILGEWLNILSIRIPLFKKPVLVFRILGILLLAFLVVTALWGDVSLIARGVWNLVF
jgi:membrane-associated protease RseP (regulator of RpoE activity)